MSNLFWLTEARLAPFFPKIHGKPRVDDPVPGNGLLANRERGRKVHLAMDTATSDIRAVEFTPSSDGDSPVLPELLDSLMDRSPCGA